MLNNHPKKQKNRNPLNVIGAFLLMGALLTNGYATEVHKEVEKENQQTQEVFVQKDTAINKPKKEDGEKKTTPNITLKKVVGLSFLCIVLHLASKGLAASMNDCIEAWREKKQYDKKMQKMIQDKTKERD